MPSLDDLRKRIASVKSTQKITKAMKMVAAAKLRKAQEMAEKGRPYSEKMDIMHLEEAGRSSLGAKTHYQVLIQPILLRVLQLIEPLFPHKYMV